MSKIQSLIRFANYNFIYVTLHSTLSPKFLLRGFTSTFTIVTYSSKSLLSNNHMNIRKKKMFFGLLTNQQTIMLRERWLIFLWCVDEERKKKHHVRIIGSYYWFITLYHNYFIYLKYQVIFFHVSFLLYILWCYIWTG